MANLGQKNGVYHIRFRFHGKEYKKSLKTSDADSAAAARRSVELTIHRLITGLVLVPNDVDLGDFILSGGTLQQPRKAVKERNLPSTNQLIGEYLQSQQPFLAKSSHSTLAMHLRHLSRHLGERADASCDCVTHRDLDGFQQTRLAERDPVTVDKERVTIRQLYKWAVTQGYLNASPAATLSPIKGGEDRPPFRTLAEIARIIERGGLTKEEILELWECLYLSPPEIAGLLATVHANAREDFAYLLHAVPAYTGMRRGEVLRLRWLEVDFEEDYLVARSRKQSRRRTEVVRRIDLHPELRQELLAWRQSRPKGQYVICDTKTLEPIEKNRANRCFWQPLRGTTWCLDSKRNWFKIGFHTYRHSFASNLAAAGVDQRVIDEFMGHTTEAMRKRYRHLFPKDRRSAIESFSLDAKRSESRPA
jgi:integrase